jgi:hypothetical protein
MPVVEVAGTKIVYENGYYPRVRPDGSIVILPIREARRTPGLQEGIPAQGSEKEIAATRPPAYSSAAVSNARERQDVAGLRRSHADASRECNLGNDVWLAEGEQLFCFRWKSSLEAGKPEGVAVARGGGLFIDGVPVRRSKGSLLQPALRLVQQKIGDVSPTAGGPISLDAWKYWYVKRDDNFVQVHQLRDPALISRRRKRGGYDLSPL